jgi:hypothetical protein
VLAQSRALRIQRGANFVVTTQQQFAELGEPRSASSRLVDQRAAELGAPAFEQTPAVAVGNAQRSAGALD